MPVAGIAAIEARMLDTLRRDAALSALVRAGGGTFRLGNLPEKTTTVSTLPLVYVAAAPTYVSSRTSIGGPPAPGVAPAESVAYMLHAVAVTRPKGSPTSAQASAYALGDAIIGALSRNLVLADAEGGDPLAHDIQMDMVERYMPTIGTDIEAVTVMARVTSIVEHMTRG